MKFFPAFIALLLPLTASADQITVTLVDQTLSTFAETYSNSAPCFDSGTTSATCSSAGQNGSGYASASINIGAIYNRGLNITAWGSETGNNGGTASATLSGTVLMTGRSGTGYLNYLPVLSATVARAQVTINGQTGFLYYSTYWSLVPFTFGQPMDYSLNLSGGADGADDYYVLANLILGDVRVYAHQPSGCAYDACTDPTYVDATSVFMGTSASVSGDGGSSSGISQAPEPATIWISGLGVLALGLIRFARG